MKTKRSWLESFAAHSVKPGGNWEGRNIPALQEAASLVGTLDDRQALADARRKLFEAREKRVRPVGDHSGSYPATAV